MRLPKLGARVCLTPQGHDFLSLKRLAEDDAYLRQYSEDELYSIASETFPTSSDAQKWQMIREIKQPPRGKQARTRLRKPLMPSKSQLLFDMGELGE